VPFGLAQVTQLLPVTELHPALPELAQDHAVFAPLSMRLYRRKVL
jgi:hypothetical protein